MSSDKKEKLDFYEKNAENVHRGDIVVIDEEIRIVTEVTTKVFYTFSTVPLCGTLNIKNLTHDSRERVRWAMNDGWRLIGKEYRIG